MSEQPTRYVGWCRPPRGRWRKVEGTEAGSVGATYGLLMELVELRGGFGMDNDFRILREGELPREDGYRDRMMRPRV